MEKGLSIALPNELPQKPDLSQVPESVLRSGVVETLIQQNEDLMARLSVNLRRHSIVEARVQELEQSLKSYKHRYEILQDQVLVLREKDETITQKALKTQEQWQNSKEKIQRLETEYAELYTQKREQQKHLMERIEGIARRLSRLIHHRKRLKRVALQMRNELRDSQKRTAHLEAQLEVEQASKYELQQKLRQSVEHIQNSSKESEANQKRLVIQYEEQLQELQSQCDQSDKQRLNLESQLEEMDDLFQKNIELENKVVSEKRAFSDFKERHHQEVQELQTQVSDFRSEAKSKTLELERLKTEFYSQKQELAATLDQKSQVDEQVESLQCLWQDNQNEISDLNDKILALQKLNQQLSGHLNESRRENRKLKDQLEQVQLTQQKAAKALKRQLQEVQKQTLEPEDEQLRPEWMHQIDNLISEIQTSTRPEESEPAEGKTESSVSPLINEERASSKEL